MAGTVRCSPGAKIGMVSEHGQVVEVNRDDKNQPIASVVVPG